MFGHKKGAFTDASSDRIGRFEMANKGTIFLDEIGDLDPSCQVKLLRVLQDQTFEVLGDSRPRKTDIRVVPLPMPICVRWWANVLSAKICFIVLI